MDSKAEQNERWKQAGHGSGVASMDVRTMTRMAWRYRFKLGIASVFMGISALATACYAYLVGPMLGVLFGGVTPAASRSPDSGFSPHILEVVAGLDPLSIGVLIVVVAAIKAAAFFLSTWLTGSVGAELLDGLRVRFYRRLLRLSPFDPAVKSIGDLVTRFTTDVDRVEEGVTKGIVSYIGHAMELAALAGLALSLDPVLGLLGLIAFPPAALLIIRIGRSVRRERTAVHLATGDMGQVVEETAAGLPIIRAFSAETLMEARFSGQSRRIRQATVRAIALRAMSSPFNEILAAIALAVTLVYSTLRIAKGDLTPEAFISFFSALLLLYQPVKGLGQAHQAVQSGMAALFRIAPFINEGTIDGTSGAPVATDIPIAPLTIRLEQAETGYGEERSILNDITLCIGPGEKVAIVGESGAGKTTLLNLLEGLIPLRHGRLLLDGHIALPTSAHRCFAPVRQEPFLFNDTILMNVRIGRADAQDAECRNAADAAGVTRFAPTLDSGVGPYGRLLSVGQRQRVCLARALVSRAPVLLLDEVTASLDGRTEQSLIDGLDEALKERTVVIVTHRLSTAAWADRLILVADGTIKADGPSGRLIAADPRVKALFGAQMTSS